MCLTYPLHCRMTCCRTAAISAGTVAEKELIPFRFFVFFPANPPQSSSQCCGLDSSKSVKPNNCFYLRTCTRDWIVKCSSPCPISLLNSLVFSRLPQVPEYSTTFFKRKHGNPTPYRIRAGLVWLIYPSSTVD
jgi:hypothetical protein